MANKDAAYHPRRSDREIKADDEIDAIIRSQKYMTIAMCSGNEPYLVTLSFGYDKERKCLFFHCATDGKKLNVLRRNPVVWGQIVQDRGYIPGECSHAYASVEFRGVVTILDDIDEKQRALLLMIDQLEASPAPVKERLVNGKDLGHVVVGRVDIQALSGKKAH
jgi:nitroimidazol reductase NimA-like FMN-containing flavoprotein (pyridoxamine 5'-phosphate oxidase superfamily)